MASDERVLSQAEIDALTAKVPVRPRPAAAPAGAPAATFAPASPPPEPARPPTPPPRPSQPEPAAAVRPVQSGEIEALQKRIDDLTRQLVKVAGLAQRIDALEETVEKQKQLLAQRNVNTWNPRETFRCGGCKSANLVAVKMKCTACGREAWIGWWPKQPAR